MLDPKNYSSVKEYLQARKPKYYNGKRDNYDPIRPKTGSICYVTVKGKNDIKNRYELINILVNNGKYDTYVLKNLKTGKIKKAINITVDNR